MLKIAARSRDRRRLIVLGLTDVNLRRLQEGRPILVPVSDFYPGVEELADVDIAILHLTRETALRIAREWAVPEAELLDALGEGMTTRPEALELARQHPELFEVRDGQVFVRPEAEGRPCPCCGLTLKGSPLPRARGDG